MVAMKETFAPIKKRPAYALVFEAIERKILAGDLEVGAALPTEHELCEQFGVQRSTVREGVRLLEQSGLVRREGGKRLHVVRPRSSEEAERARRGLTRHGVSFAEVWESMLMVLPQIARKAAMRSEPATHEALEAITARLREATEALEIVELTGAYYEAMTKAVGNRLLDVVLKSMNKLTHPSLLAVVEQLPEPGGRSAKMQAAITEALRGRDPDSAARFTEKHLTDMRRGYAVAGVPIDAEIGVYEASGEAT